MKAILLVLAIFLGSIFLWNFVSSSNNNELKTPNTSSKSQKSKIIFQNKDKKYLFVPYWTITNKMDASGFDSVIYFGLNVDSLGINTKDNGYQNLGTFISNTKNSKEKILAVVITDSNTASEVIKNATLQNKISDDAIKIAKENGFNGVLLDFETSAFGFESTTNKITSFYNSFSQKAHNNNLLFYSTLFGDTYFQARAYDVPKIGQVSDKVLIMAYDFTKSHGNPGPDFPLSDNNNYGYDFDKMVSDFQKDVPNEKLVVTLGYFGYDWTVDSQNNSLASGVALSTNEIEKDFVDSCKYKNCKLSRVSTSEEPFVTYVDNENQKHVVWFEDAESIAKKIEFLKSRGIREIGIWAYSYY